MEIFIIRMTYPSPPPMMENIFKIFLDIRQFFKARLKKKIIYLKMPRWLSSVKDFYIWGF